MVEERSPEEVKRRIEEGGTQIVDIRSREEYEEGHIPGAINIPMAELPAKVADVEWGDDIVCACPIGQSSVQAAKLIRSFEGVDDDAAVTSMAGGYEEWEYDLERGSDEAVSQ